ncbi:MAG: sterol esterase-like protein [Piptocephalis tieghemiana]|nr:MAG: sterol esterase-like protein [Piptocephalis tieghemiana]
MGIPFFGRLHLDDYQSLFLTCLALFVEKVFRILTFFIPSPVIAFIFSKLPWNTRKRYKEHHIIHTVASFCQRAGYPIEEHLVTTTDGFVLGVHRIPGGKKSMEESMGQEDGSFPSDSPDKPIVLLWHGFMMSSEVFVCGHTEERNLAFALASAGYDVWMGNIRGNKYSYKHLTEKPNSRKFWDFSIDELARYDIPNTIDYILRTTGQDSLSYIGFSQGTAQMFAALSISPELNDKVNCFIALAPATKPPMIENASVSAVLRSSPQALYLILGRKCAMGYALFWRDYLPRPLYVKLIRLCVWLLFGWSMRNMSQLQKEACLGHLYSYTATKLVVHWFQIMGAQRFQVFDDAPPVRSTILQNADSRINEEATFGHVVPAFPTRRINTPIAIFYGGQDNLSNIQHLLKDLPEPVLCRRVDKYEHLDFLWADDADELLFPMVFGTLASLAIPKGEDKELRKKNLLARRRSLMRERP